MKKKHFLFTSLTIAAILSANVAQAEELTGPVTDPSQELVDNENQDSSPQPHQEGDLAINTRFASPTEEPAFPLGDPNQPGVEVTIDRQLNQTAVREEALTAMRELREEMWDLNPWFDGKKLQDVVKASGFQGKADYAQALEWDNELEAYAVQRSVEVSYVWAHNRPDGSDALDTAPEKVNGENLSMGYPTVTAAIKQSWGYGELDALNATQGFLSKPGQKVNGHLHNQLNPRFKSFGVGASEKHYAQSLSFSASEQADGLKFDGKHTIKLKVTEELAKHEDFVIKTPKNEEFKKEEPKNEKPKKEEPKPEESTPKIQKPKTILVDRVNLNSSKGALPDYRVMTPGDTLTNEWDENKYEYIVGQPGTLTYDQIEDGGTYVTIVRSKDRASRLSWGETEYRLLDFLNSDAFTQVEKESIREAALDILRQQLADTNIILDNYELTEEQRTSVQTSSDKYLLTFNNLRTGVADSSTLPTREENIAFDAVVDLWQSFKLKSKPWSDNKAYKGETKTITIGFSNAGMKGVLNELTIRPWETIGGTIPGSGRVYVLGSSERLTYDQIEDGGYYLTAFHYNGDGQKISLASHLFSWLDYKLDQKSQDAVQAAIAKLLDEEMIDATRLLGGFELDATQKTLVQSHYDKASLALDKLKKGENGASVLPNFKDSQSFGALRTAGENGELAVKVKTLLSDQNGSQLTVETSPEDAVASLEVLAHIEPTEVNPSPIARLAGQDFDLYDIKLKDAQGQLVSNLKQNALVKLPVDSGKEVTKVIYLPETGEATELPILKQDEAFVYFETNHFSHYGIVYKTAEPSTPKQPQGQENKQQTPAPQGQEDNQQPPAPQTQTGMDIEAIKNGDYSSIQGVWNKVNDEQGQPEFIRITDNGFFSAPELNFKAVKLGEVKEVPNRYKWGRMVVASSAGYPTDWLGYHNSEGSGATYIPKGGAYSLWDANLGKSVEKIATEDIIISRGLGYEAVYNRAGSVDHFYGVTAGDYGMGTLVDSLGRSIVDNKTVVVTGQIGDTIDLNAVGGRFGREGNAIYLVTLSNGKDELTLPDYQSSFVLDETTKGYTKISIVYDTAMPKPKVNDNNSKQNQPDKAPDTAKPNTNPNSGERQAYTAEQELIARVWKTVTGGTYPYGVVRREAGSKINYFNGIGHVFPKVTYYISEHSNRPNALSHEVTFSDNGDGTVTVYKVPKHWHVADEESERLTKEILDTAQVIKLDELSKSEIETIVKRATRIVKQTIRYEGFSNGSSKNSTPQGQGNNQQPPAPQADLSTRRNQLLLELDKSPLTDEQKGQLAEKFAFANTEKELADVTAEFKGLTAALGQDSKQQTPQAPQKADAKATLPATGEAKPAVLATIGAGLLLASLGLVYHRKRSE